MNKSIHTYAIVPDLIWDGVSDHPRPDKAAVIGGSTIQAVVDAAALPARIERLVLPDCTLLPGLMDAHVHFCDWMRPAFLAAGVTTIRDVGNDLAWILERRRYAQRHPERSPRILCCGPLLDGPAAHWPIMGKAHEDRTAMETSVESVIRSGVDAVKLYVNITRDQMNGAVCVAHRHDRHILAHLGAISVEEAAEAGVDEIEHLAGCTAAWRDSPPEILDALCDTLLPSGMVMCPTLVVWDRIGRVCEPAFRQDRRLRWTPERFRWAWTHYPWCYVEASQRLDLQHGVVSMKRCLARMQAKRLPIIAGSDTPFPYLIPGFSIHDELGLMVDAGLTPVEALRSATSAAARVLRIDGEAGTLEAGKQADLLAVRGDPTQDIHAIAQVVQVIRNGARLKTSALHRMARRLHAAPLDDPVCRDIIGYVRQEIKGKGHHHAD